MKQCLFWLLIASAVAIGLRYPIADIPLERDEGEYAYIAQRWLDGEIPYTHSFCQKPPGIFVAYAAILRWIGSSPSAIHWATQILSLGTIIFLFFLSWRLFSISVAAAASLLCAYLSTHPQFYGQSANTEIFMIFFLTAAMVSTIAAAERDSLFWSFATGILLAMALLIKQVALPQMALSFVYVGWTAKKRGPLLGSMLFGTMLGMLSCVLYFVWHGAWGPFYECVFGYNLKYVGQISLCDYPRMFWFSVKQNLSSLWPILVFSLWGWSDCLRKCFLKKYTVSLVSGYKLNSSSWL